MQAHARVARQLQRRARWPAAHDVVDAAQRRERAPVVVQGGGGAGVQALDRDQNVVAVSWPSPLVVAALEVVVAGLHVGGPSPASKVADRCGGGATHGRASAGNAGRQDGRAVGQCRKALIMQIQ